MTDYIAKLKGFLFDNEFSKELKANLLIAWKCFSVHAAVLLAAVPLAWSQMPDDLKSQMPHGPYIIFASTILLVYLARSVPQKSLPSISASLSSTDTSSQ